MRLTTIALVSAITLVTNARPASAQTSLQPGFNSIRGIASNQGTLFAASYLNGVKVSFDQGLTWQDRNAGLPDIGGHIFVESVGHDGTWTYAALHQGVFRSNNDGLNWSAPSVGIASNSYNHVERFLAVGNITLAVMSEDAQNGGGIFRTEDNGDTWMLSSAGLFGCGKVNDLVAINGVIYASCTNGLFMSTDQGWNWNQVPSVGQTFSYAQCTGQENSQVIANNQGLHFSQDGGLSWQPSIGPTTFEHAELRSHDGQFIAVIHGTDRGIWTSSTGLEWTKLTGVDPLDELALEKSHLFGNSLLVGSITDIYRIDGSGISIAPKVFLGANFNPDQQLMNDQLRSMDLIPLQEPYTALGYDMYGGGGNETILPEVLDITGPNAIVDWVLLEFRSGSDERNILVSKAAILQRDGDVVSTTGIGPVVVDLPAGEYFVSVKHRVHLGVMSKQTLELSAMPTSLDISSDWAMTYGTQACKDVVGTYVLWPGNAKHNGLTAGAGPMNDRDAILQRLGGNSINAVIGGYLSEDLNMDGMVKYDGPENDRILLMDAIGTHPTSIRVAQLPPSY